MTEVNPAKVDAVAPNEMLVEPTVNELFVSDALAMLVSVFDAPLIVLLVSVWAAVLVVTVSETTWAEAMLNAPPVIVLLVNVKALGNEITGV